mmetsp:Transcript_16244/g.32068  ORF Transcript_16244/g.32068 Transcript_16244/m.32068 type:complete len:299 (-) Transcript_16244:795-1691(-)
MIFAFAFNRSLTFPRSPFEAAVQRGVWAMSPFFSSMPLTTRPISLASASACILAFSASILALSAFCAAACEATWAISACILALSSFCHAALEAASAIGDRDAEAIPNPPGDPPPAVGEEAIPKPPGGPPPDIGDEAIPNPPGRPPPALGDDAIPKPTGEEAAGLGDKVFPQAAGKPAPALGDEAIPREAGEDTGGEFSPKPSFRIAFRNAARAPFLSAWNSCSSWMSPSRHISARTSTLATSSSSRMARIAARPVSVNPSTPLSHSCRFCTPLLPAAACPPSPDILSSTTSCRAGGLK